MYLAMHPNFKLPLTKEGSEYLEELGIKEDLVEWKKLFD
jgi:hypothetical protein